jgi:hypothetical protein
MWPGRRRGANALEAQNKTVTDPRAFLTGIKPVQASHTKPINDHTE